MIRRSYLCVRLSRVTKHISQLIVVRDIRPSLRSMLLWLLCVTAINTSIFVVVSRNNERSPMNIWVSAREQKFHNHIIAAGSNFISNWDRSPFQNPASEPEFAFAVITTKRALSYVQTWVWSLLAGNSEENLSKIALSFINMNSLSNEHTDLEPFRNLSGIPIIDTFPDVRVHRSVQTWVRNQYLGYALALRSCLSSNASMCVVFEDDGLLMWDFISKLRHLIGSFRNDKPNLSVKLYVGDFLTGFATDNFIFELCLIPALIAVSVVLFALVVFRPPRKQPTTSKPASSTAMNKHRYWKIAFLILTIYINIVVAMLLFSRQSFLSWFQPQEHVLIECTEKAGNVAILYPRESASALHDHLVAAMASPNNLAPIDLEMFDWMKSTNDWDTMQCIPSIVQHVGVITSAPEKSHFGKYERRDSRYRFGKDIFKI